MAYLFFIQYCLAKFTKLSKIFYIKGLASLVFCSLYNERLAGPGQSPMQLHRRNLYWIRSSLLSVRPGCSLQLVRDSPWQNAALRALRPLWKQKKFEKINKIYLDNIKKMWYRLSGNVSAYILDNKKSGLVHFSLLTFFSKWIVVNFSFNYYLEFFFNL